MSLRDELVKVYKANTYDTPEYQAEFDKLKQKMMDVAANSKHQYEVTKDEFPIIMKNFAVTRIWLDNNDLMYEFSAYGSIYNNLTIKWA